MDWWEGGEVKSTPFCTSGLISLEEPRLFCWRHRLCFIYPLIVGTIKKPLEFLEVVQDCSNVELSVTQASNSIKLLCAEG